MPESMKKVATFPHHELFIAEADDILIVVPEAGFKDTAEFSRVTVAFLQEYARKLGKKCGLVIVVNNILDQGSESRHIYAEGVGPELFFGIAMVVNNLLARMIGNFALHLTTLQVPLCLVENIEAASAWLEALRKP